MPDCLECSHCVWVHEYECYICSKQVRMPFDMTADDPEDCLKFEKYLEEENHGND